MDIEKILEETGAILKGHFLLSSGLHSDKYFQIALVFQYPEYGEKIAFQLAKMFKDEKIDVVIGPAIGGIILSYELGRILKARSIFAERENGKMRLRRGFDILEGERVLICEDVITTGLSVGEVIEIVREKKGEIVGIGCIVERGKAEFPYPVKSLLKLEIKNYHPSECPLCKKGIPLVKPGSRR
ncbi:MAG: orotate phosphoribosyltransferase [Candidatus Omnitrophota bacterium]|nr:MAG: orotate phosphoribosyltransferase [Candidatus Omnitrophota bacterium]HDN97761.1 orotate phosphoribosyltransferase [bacterium]